ncbi:hypothetical protein ACFQL1_10875 [Halomicroarcula sp. GCM10025709]|uniref:hypothetical protein n=1 Tax=Halomicroarcula sp. GCM10025709 TaxID=3252669 RepID=UPI00360FEE2A
MWSGRARTQRLQGRPRVDVRDGLGRAGSWTTTGESRSRKSVTDREPVPRVVPAAATAASVA